MMMRFWQALVFAAVATAAAAQPIGTKNFTAPTGVPNYFSNEAGAPLGSGGIVHPRMPRVEIVEEAPSRSRARVASSSRRDTGRHVSARDKRRNTKLAAARKKRATKLAAERARKAKLATVKKKADQKAAAAKAPATDKADEQGRATPAKPKSPAAPGREG